MTTIRTSMLSTVMFLAALLCLAPAASAQIDFNSDPNAKNWDEMMHYIAIGHWELAEGYGQALLNGDPDPQLLLDLAENPRYVGSYRNLNLLAPGTPLKGIAEKVLKLIEEGRFMRRTDQAAIAAEIKRLSGTTRARMLAVKRLIDSGEWAVPLMIQALRDPSRADELLNIRWALPQLGRNAVNPLMVVLQHHDNLKIRLIVLDALKKIGYKNTLPIIGELAQTPEASSELKSAVLATISALDPAEGDRLTPAAQLFRQLAEDYYNHLPSLAVPANQDLANIWFWHDRDGLYFEAVPRDAFDELMAMRYCEDAVRLDRSMASAISLWLSAFFRLEAAGHQQPAYFGPNHADASTYAVTAGPQYLHRVLARAINNDNRWRVALPVIHALQRNSGQQSLLYEVQSQQPLLRALTFGDREVRFSAALTIGAALPHQPFEQSEFVMPLLSQALRQKGDYYGIVVDTNPGRRTTLAGELREMGMAKVIVGDNFPVTLEQAKKLPSFDLIVLSGELAMADLRNAVDIIARDYRLAFCPTIIIANQQDLSNIEPLKQEHSFLDVAVTGTSAADIMGLTRDVLTRNNTAPFAAETADSYAVQAATTILQLTISENKVLDVTVAQPALIDAVYDQRTTIQNDAVATLARIESTRAQRAVARLALDENVDLATRLMAFKQLSLSAKRFGNMLLPEQVNDMYAIVATLEEDIQLRRLAAEAYGALNLPSAKIAELITTHSPTPLE